MKVEFKNKNNKYVLELDARNPNVIAIDYWSLNKSGDLTYYRTSWRSIENNCVVYDSSVDEIYFSEEVRSIINRYLKFKCFW